MDFDFFKWLMRVIPRAPKKAGLLMRLYYIWQENFTPAGRAAMALIPFSMVAGMVPGLWAAWVFCGLDFLLFIALMLSLFATSKMNKIELEQITIPPIFEGERGRLCAVAVSKPHKKGKSVKKIDSLLLGAYRLPSDLICIESETMALQQEMASLSCGIRATHRGAYLLTHVAAVVPEIMGLVRWPFFYKGSIELLVYPKIIQIQEFLFLSSGANGRLFASVLMPSLNRGYNFVGIREYREGDSLRDIHHKAFARYGRPFTKEFENERGAGIILLLDTSAPKFKKRIYLEKAISITAGIALWLLERNVLGRFFIDDEEISLCGGSESKKNILESLARIPRADVVRYKKPYLWSPAARPMDPVLRVGLYAEGESLNTSQIHKHVVVGRFANGCKLSGTSSVSLNAVESTKDNVLFVDVSNMPKLVEVP